MSIETIRTKLAERIGALLDAEGKTIGVVHPYEPWANDWAVLLARFKIADPAQIRAWTIARSSLRYVTLPGRNSVVQRREHSIVIRGYMALADQHPNDPAKVETDPRFQDNVGIVCDALLPPAGQDELRLDAGLLVMDPPEARVIDSRMFGGVLCHYCEIIFRVSEGRSCAR